MVWETVPTPELTIFCYKGLVISRWWVVNMTLAFELIDRMQEKGLAPDITTYTQSLGTHVESTC